MTNQAQDKDQPMEDHQNTCSGGQREEWIHHSLSNKQLSHLPMHQWSCCQEDPESSLWTHDLFTDAILHDTDLCSVCKRYFDHCHQSRRQKLPSLEDTLEERAALTVPIKEHDKLYAKYEERTEHGQDMFEEIKSIHANYDAARRQLRELTEKHKELLHSQIGSNSSFKRKKVASEQVFEPAQWTMHPLPVRETPPSTVHQSAAPLPIAMAVPAVMAPAQLVASSSRSAEPLAYTLV